MMLVCGFIQAMRMAVLIVYQIGPSYTTLEEGEQEGCKAIENLIIHNGQAVACLEVAGNEARPLGRIRQGWARGDHHDQQENSGGSA